MKTTEEIIKKRITLNEIPVHFLQWLVSSRIKFLDDLKSGKPLRYFSAHLPVMVTWQNNSSPIPPSVRGGMGEVIGNDKPFPVNMTVKGIGLLPKRELLDDYRDIFEGVIAESRAVPWNDSLHKRIEAMNMLYGNMDNFDSTLLGGLEIFGGRTLENLRENPYASLLFVGMSNTSQGIQYISFQVNGVVEIL